MNNAVITAVQKFTAAKGGVFAAHAVRVDASHALPTMERQTWRPRTQAPITGIDHEPLPRPVCLI